MTDLGADLEGVKVPVLPEAVLRFCGGINIGLSEADTVEGCGRVEAILGPHCLVKLSTKSRFSFHNIRRGPLTRQLALPYLRIN